MPDVEVAVPPFRPRVQAVLRLDCAVQRGRVNRWMSLQMPQGPAGPLTCYSAIAPNFNSIHEDSLDSL